MARPGNDIVSWKKLRHRKFQGTFLHVLAMYKLADWFVECFQATLYVLIKHFAFELPDGPNTKIMKESCRARD